MQKLTQLAEKIFVVLALFLSTTALIPMFLNGDDASGIAPDPFSPIVFTSIYTVTIVLIALNWKSFVYVARKDFAIWLLVGIAMASILWTQLPDITSRRSILLLGTTTFGVYLAVRYSFREQLQLMAIAFGLVIALSFVFAIFLPSYGQMTAQEGGIHAGAWRGVMPHKNLLGRLMALSSIVFLLTAIANPMGDRRYRWLTWSGYVLSIVLVILSTSKTALVVSLVLLMILPLYRAWRLNYSFLIPFMIAFVLIFGSAATLFIGNLDAIAGALGRDLTLTGRTEIWAAMLELISQRPWGGYGYNAFWQGWDAETSAYMWRVLGWECPYGHNGFMDLLSELGISGLAVFIFSFFTTYAMGVNWLRAVPTPEGLWPLMFLTYLLIYNISESTLLASNSIFWIVYVSVIFSMALESEQIKMFTLNSTFTEE
jgi:exopolysaccharide production protein ExoQ